MGFGFANIASSQELDFISLATNGALNEQSEGVKVLSDEEMREVKGGYLRMDFGTNKTLGINTKADKQQNVVKQGLEH